MNDKLRIGTREAFPLDNERLLALAIRDLDGVVLPHVKDSAARFTGKIVVKLLRLLKARSFDNGLQREVADAASRMAEASPDEQDYWPSVIDLAEQQDLLDLGGIKTSLADSYAESGAGDVLQVPAKASESNKLTAEGLARHVGRMAGASAPADVTEFREVGTGSQKSIFFATVRDAHGDAEWALRQDKSFSSFNLSVVDEFPILEQLSAAGLPVPRPVWLAEAGPDVGWAVCATERLSGSANYAAWSQDPAVAFPIVREVATVLACLHVLPVKDLTSARHPLPGTTGNTPIERAEDLAAFWMRIGLSNPVVDICLAWLRANAPRSFSRTALVHGDFAFHNLLVADGRLTGVLDWEFAHLGDPMEDLVYIRPFAETMHAWDTFLDAYRQAGGISFDESVARYWAVFGMLRLAIGSFHNIKVVRDGRTDLDIRVANSGYLYAGRLLIDATKIIARLD